MASTRVIYDSSVYADVDDSDSSDSEKGDDWNDCGDTEDEIIINSTCLFCSITENSPDIIWEHILKYHNFDISLAKVKYNLDCFEYIKMVNYCRKNQCTADSLITLDPTVWTDETFLMPIIENDGLLQFDIESLDVSEVSENSALFESNLKSDTDSSDNSGFRHNEDQTRPELELALERAMQELEMIKKAAQEMMLGSKGSDFTESDLVPSHQAIKKLKNDEDESYFSSYGHFSIHQDMLKDQIRTNFYKNCIEKNAHLFKDKIVLDIGCGTGILSMFAAKAGAKLVVGVEMSDIIYQAMDIIRENKLEDKVKLVKGRMEDVDLPVEKVDIIISEWMGYFLLFESMLDTVIWARDHYLKPGGHILPDFCSISVVGMEDIAQHQNNVTYWNDVYGFKMSCMRTLVLQEASVIVVNKTNAFTDASTLKEIDIINSSTKDLEFTSAFSIKAEKDMEVSAFVSYFDVAWKNCDNSIMFSTSPFKEPTHWKQTVFLLQSPIALQTGEILQGTLQCRKNRKDPRSLNVVISVKDKTLKYLMQ